MLGHASAAMTMDVYGGLFESDLDKVAEKCVQFASRMGRDALASGPNNLSTSGYAEYSGVPSVRFEL